MTPGANLLLTSNQFLAVLQRMNCSRLISHSDWVTPEMDSTFLSGLRTPIFFYYLHFNRSIFKEKFNNNYCVTDFSQYLCQHHRCGLWNSLPITGHYAASTKPAAYPKLNSAYFIRNNSSNTTVPSEIAADQAENSIINKFRKKFGWGNSSNSVRFKYFNLKKMF